MSITQILKALRRGEEVNRGVNLIVLKYEY